MKGVLELAGDTAMSTSSARSRPRQNSCEHCGYGLVLVLSNLASFSDCITVLKINYYKETNQGLQSDESQSMRLNSYWTNMLSLI